MIKKITLVFVLIFSFFVWNNVFTNICSCWDCEFGCYWDLEKAIEAQKASADNWWAKSWEWQDKSQDITSSDFIIETDFISVWWENLKVEWNSKATINKVLWTIIQKLMIALWVVSLFIMTIWAWYIILFHGQDEYLSKWKNIFIAWITSLVIALSSYYLVNLVWYILYK